MKFLSIVCLSCLCLFSAFVPPVATAAEIPGLIATYNFPGIQGNIVKMMFYADKYSETIGDNLVLFTEGNTFVRPEAGPDAGRSKELHAYGFTLMKSGTLRQDWQLKDFVYDCDVDITVEFQRNALQITDLDNDGTAETWMIYYLGCRGDVSPITMNLVMRDGFETYTMRGETRVGTGRGDHVGGEYSLSEAFTSGPAEFTAFAKKLWEQYKDY